MSDCAAMSIPDSHNNGGGLLPAAKPFAPGNLKNASGLNSEASSAIALPHAVAEWPRNSRETTRVRLDTYMGRTVVDVRNWYVGSDGELRPGKGVTMDVRHLPALANGISEALKAACIAGLVEGGEA